MKNKTCSACGFPAVKDDCPYSNCPHPPAPKKIFRNDSTPEGKRIWDAIDKLAAKSPENRAKLRAEAREELLKNLTKLEYRACDCDVMNGWTCDSHTIIRQMKEQIEQLYNL